MSTGSKLQSTLIIRVQQVMGDVNSLHCQVHFFIVSQVSPLDQMNFGTISKAM